MELAHLVHPDRSIEALRGLAHPRVLRPNAPGVFCGDARVSTWIGAVPKW